MKTPSKRRIDTIFVLIIFSVFALSVLMVLMLGARVYKSMTDIAKERQDERTLLSYVWTKVKINDKNGSIRIGEYFGLNVLCFDEEYEQTMYTTAIYLHDGWVYELYTETSLLAESDPQHGFAPEDGVKVMGIESLEFTQYSHGLIKVATNTSHLLIYPRSAETVIGGRAVS